MTVVMPAFDAPDELRSSVAPLLPRLAGQGVEGLVIFSYGRPGEGLFWQAFLFVAGKRHSLGTPDLRTEALVDQVADLVRQLEAFESRSGDAAHAWSER